MCGGQGPLWGERPPAWVVSCLEGGRGWLVSAEQAYAPLRAAWPTASTPPKSSTGLSALLREPNDFILMGHDSTQGNR